MATRAAVDVEPGKAPWSELLREGRASYVIIVLAGVMIHALQILVMTIIMPSVVADIGGAAYYTWASMLYTIGSIIGAASVGPVWSAVGQRRGYALGVLVLLAGTTICAVAPNMGALIVARAVQGFAGGLVVGGSMALIGTLFADSLRTRIMAVYQGIWMVAQLLGPVVGGVFAEIGWWRGSFWSMVPLILVFAVLVWIKLPGNADHVPPRAGAGGIPALRLTLLTLCVFAIAAAGPVGETWARVALVAAAVALLWLCLRLDAASPNRLYPTGALSPRAPVGLALLIMFLVGVTQTSVSIFLPLLLQVVHGVSPLVISVLTMTISAGWTVGTFIVSGWSGARERFALLIGPVLILLGLVTMAVTAERSLLPVLIGAAFVFGMGMGTHNVHLVSRTLANAARGEERITASSMPSMRSLGTASGAAIAGMLSSIAGLGSATEAEAVGGAVTFVYSVTIATVVMIGVLMVRLVRLGMVRRDDG